MENNSLFELYFKWLCEIAIPDEKMKSKYTSALVLLHSIPFKATKKMQIDNNRAIDGIDLRYHFSYACKIPLDIIDESLKNCFFYENQCSVLEMLVALARRCEDSIMADTHYGDRTHVWFWHMFHNLRLNVYDNSKFHWPYDEEMEEAIRIIIERFLNREYEYDGTGNIFKFDYPNFDVREIEIWDQMCLYMIKIANSDLV